MNNDQREISAKEIPAGITAKPRNTAGLLAVQIYAAALSAVRVDALVCASVRLDGDRLFVQDLPIDISGCQRLVVVGAGKASAGMAAALEKVLGDRIAEGVVVTKCGHSVPTHRIRILEAGHPLPDEDSVEAGRQVFALAESAGPADLVICLLSGGASALMELPADGITLDDLRTTTEMMLRAGADISELNAVRRRLSRLKAGGLARAAFPARVVCLVLSDVLGNSLESIGSGPCWLDDPTGITAKEALEGNGLAPLVPPAVSRLLTATKYSARDHLGGLVSHHILGDIWSAIDAARQEAVRLGLKPIVLTGRLEGEASAAGRLFGAISSDLARATPEHDSVIAGGETTVTVTGSGRGGRAQELAAAAAPYLPAGASLLCAGTDGTDGPTDAAGGLVDHQTWERAAFNGVEPSEALRNNDTYRLLEAAESLIHTGPTLTNVNDLVILVGPRSPDARQ